MNKENKLFQFFSKNFPFNKNGLNELIHSFEEELYKKGDIILQAESVEKKLKFITTGFIREYYTTDAKDVNINFYEENEFATDFNSFFENKKTEKWQQCLTDVTVLTISRSKLDEFLKKYNCANSIIQQTFQKMLNKKESIEYKKITKSTEEQYKDIQSKKPNWLKHIPQYHIASYLNITPETLSRIRKRIY